MSIGKDDPMNEQSLESNTALEIDPFRVQRFQEEIKANQNLPLGFIGGGAAAIVGAILWALITVITDYQMGLMAIGVGFLVGYAVQIFGKGVDTIFGIMGAGLALVGCLAGNFLAIVAIISQTEEIPLLTVFGFLITAPSAIIEFMILTFSPIDLLFYGLAIYEGYKLSFRRFTETELLSLTKETM